MGDVGSREEGGFSGAPLTHRVASRPSDVSQPRENPIDHVVNLLTPSLETQYSDCCTLNPRLRMSSVSYHLHMHPIQVLKTK